MEIQYSQLKINHLNDTPSTKAAGGGIFSGVFQQGCQGTNQGKEDFELSWYLFFQHQQFAKKLRQISIFRTGAQKNISNKGALLGNISIGGDKMR